ncbi:vacuolar protein sorting 45A [Ramicandelaber brevisporus]|nr:vacuolar protein sorting 45A [Ramicandelaber brevisporus]
MDVVKAAQFYTNKMLAEVSGMKVLLMDSETTAIVSVIATQTQLLSKETFLVDRIDNPNREKMRHLKCICFIRPTEQSIQRLVTELRQPLYGDYYIYFSNAIKKSVVERLAEADEWEVVREVHEYFCDYSAVGPTLFSLNFTTAAYPLFADGLFGWDARTLARTTEGLASVLLALKQRPMVRYERNSQMAFRLAQELNYVMAQDASLFDFRRPAVAAGSTLSNASAGAPPPLLLLLDRRNDPVTPLLTQWTYQAMVHELLGIDNGRIDLSSVPGVRPEMKEVVLDANQDQFYSKSLLLNFGSLGESIKSYVDEYQTRTKSHAKIDSIQDMKRFVEDYPEFRKLSSNVTKHVTIVSELSRIVERDALLQVSELEQSLACNESHNSDLKLVEKVIENPRIPGINKTRLVMLYALRYEQNSSNATSALCAKLAAAGVSSHLVSLVTTLIKYAGTQHRQGDLFSNKDVFARGRNALSRLKGVENVYTQHVPPLMETLDLISKGKLRDMSHPFFDPPSTSANSAGGVVTSSAAASFASTSLINTGNTAGGAGGSGSSLASTVIPQTVIVFMIGGATLEELRFVSQFNASSNQGIQVILGGTSVLNSYTFIDELSFAAARNALSTRP